MQTKQHRTKIEQIKIIAFAMKKEIEVYKKMISPMVILHLQERTSNTRPSSQFLDTPGHCLSGALARWKGSVLLGGAWGVGCSAI
jgi:hypothetical protein